MANYEEMEKKIEELEKEVEAMKKIIDNQGKMIDINDKVYDKLSKMVIEEMKRNNEFRDKVAKTNKSMIELIKLIDNSNDATAFNNDFETLFEMVKNLQEEVSKLKNDVNTVAIGFPKF